MELKLEHYYSSAWRDISDFLEASDSVPFITKNSDGTIRSERFSFKIAGTLRGTSPYPDDFDFTYKEPIRITVDGDYIFYGHVKSGGFDYSNHIFDVEIANGLDLLKDITILDGTLDTLIKTGNFWYQYLALDNYGRELGGVLWIIEKTFEAVGLTLDTSEVANEVLFYDATVGFEKDITYGDLLVWVAMFRCLGSEYATGGSGNSEVWAFDFISEICAALYLRPVVTGSASYKLIVCDNVGYSLSDDDIFEYSPSAKEGENLSFKVIWKYHSVFNDYMAVGTSTELDTTVEFGSAQEETKGTYLNSLWIFWTDVPPSDYDPPLGDLYTYRIMMPVFQYSHPLNSWNPVVRKLLIWTQLREIEQYRCPMQTTIKDVLENHVDLANRTSEIIEEAFV